MQPSCIIFLTNYLWFNRAARGAKVNFLKHIYAQYKDHFDAVNISDIATGEFPEVLEGVDAVIHTASPLPDKASKDVILEVIFNLWSIVRNQWQEYIKGAVNGTINIIRQAQKAGIKRLIVTSSIASVSNPQQSFTDKGVLLMHFRPRYLNIYWCLFQIGTRWREKKP